MAKKLIPSTVHFIVGLPYQAFRDCINDLKFLAGKRVFLGQSIFYPVMESPFFKDLKKSFSASHRDYAFFRSSSAYFDKFISRDRIFFVFYLSRIINFIKALIDDFSLNEGNYKAFLYKRAGRFRLKENVLVSCEKLDKVTLGIVLIKKLLEENIVFRVEEEKKENKFIYRFFEEEFISGRDLKKSLTQLKIKGISGMAIKL